MRAQSLISLMALGCAAIGFAPAEAAAQRSGCQIRVETNPVDWVIRGFDPFETQAPVAQFDLVLVNEGEADCTVSPLFQLDQESFGLRAGNGGGQPMVYSLYDQSNGVDATPRAGRSQRRPTSPRVRIAARQQQLVRYQFAVDADTVPGDGLFSQQLTVELEDERGAVVGQRRIMLGIDILPSARIGLAGAYRINDGRPTIDLGELRQGIAPVPLQLRVASTRRYRLGFESRNNGRLMIPGTEWAVSYHLRAGDQVVPLDRGVSEIVGANGRGYSREAVPVHFVIGDVSTQRAGLYSDIVTITVATQ